MINKKKNIIVDTAIECNLLCKIVIDYISSKRCAMKKDTNSQYIQYEKGSFINYRDTNYEVDKVYFYSPSRHSIDGEKFDLEVNIHHGGDERLTAHSHYHNDKEDSTPLRKHFHYHSEQDKHHDSNNGIRSEIVSCILFNIGDHKGSLVNVFFNQFVHKLRNLRNLNENEYSIDVHSNWNIDRLLPDRKSFFLYEYEDKTVIVFDNVQSIESGIFDIIKNYSITSLDTEPLKINNLFYRTNVEMITDEQYKKSKREQIKDLLSIARLHYMKEDTTNTREYIDMADKIYAESTGTGSLGNFHEEQETALEIENLWNNWGKGSFTENTSKSIFQQIPDSDNEREIFFRGIEVIPNDYIAMFENVFKEQLNGIFKDFYEVQVSDFFVSENEIEKKLGQETPDYLKEFYKIENIRKHILYYNKLILPKFFIEKSYTYYEEENLNINNIFKKLISFTGNKTEYDLEEENYFILIDNKLNFRLEKFTEAKEEELKGNKIEEELEKEDILYEGIFPYYKQDNHSTVYKIMDLGHDIYINEDNKVDPIPEDNNNRILLQIYRFILYLSNNYKEQEVDLIMNVVLNIFGKERGKIKNKIFDENSFIEKDSDDKSVSISMKKIGDFGDGIKFYLSPSYKDTLYNIFNWINESGSNFDIKINMVGEEMSRTVDNEECQDWLSNDVQYEGSLWKFWEKPPIFPTEGKKWDDLSYTERNYIRDGLLKAHIGDEKEKLEEEDTLKWFRHNKCRNPGNSKAGPWCYTKNPNKRWDYCVKPDYTKYIARWLLVFIFISIVFVAILFVKYLFRFEVISKIVAKLTGAQFASDAVYKTQQVINTAKTNLKNMK